MHGPGAMPPHGDFAIGALYNLIMDSLCIRFGGCVMWFRAAQEPIR
jgi:hypothetical protein